MFINQLTQDPTAKWYFDSVIETESEYVFNGWIYSRYAPIEKIFSGNTELEFTRIKRTDVAKAMGTFDDMLGVSFKIPKDHQDLPISVNLLEDGSSVDERFWASSDVVLGSPLKWIAYYSGFNRDHKDLIVIDNFYKDPDLIRKFGMSQLGFAPSDYHKGQRSEERFWLEGTKEKFEHIIGRKITNWDNLQYANGVFQFCTAQDPIVYHVDTQTYAAMVFLTPDAPVETGTAFYKSKVNGATEFDGTHNLEDFINAFKGLSNELNFYDSTQYELMDEVANVYNRLVLFNAKRIHAATKYFGDAIENARFFQLFFFDVE